MSQITGKWIGDGQITTPKIADGAVISSKIEDEAVVPSKIDSTANYTLGSLIVSNAAATGDVLIEGNLQVYGTNSFQALAIAGDATIGGNCQISGQAVVNDTLTVANALTVNSGLIQSSPLSFLMQIVSQNGPLSLVSNNDALQVTSRGGTFISSNGSPFNFLADTTTSGGVLILGNSLIVGDATVQGNLDVVKTASLNVLRGIVENTGAGLGTGAEVTSRVSGKIAGSRVTLQPVGTDAQLGTFSNDNVALVRNGSESMVLTSSGVNLYTNLSVTNGYLTTLTGDTTVQGNLDVVGNFYTQSGRIKSSSPMLSALSLLGPSDNGGESYVYVDTTDITLSPNSSISGSCVKTSGDASVCSGPSSPGNLYVQGDLLVNGSINDANTIRVTGTISGANTTIQFPTGYTISNCMIVSANVYISTGNGYLATPFYTNSTTFMYATAAGTDIDIDLGTTTLAVFNGGTASVLLRKI
jgi:cytoskeletal protein CcmA (bactofilin family)